MEDAYNELYQQFLCLRSLCLKQAALLHQLTSALQKQGVSVPNGELSSLMSIPVQCTQEIPVYLHEKPQPLTAETRNPVAQSGIDRLSRNVGTVSEFLSEDMSKLCMDISCQRKEDVKVEQKPQFLTAMDASRCHGASPCEQRHPGQSHLGGHRTHYRMPVTDRLSLGGDIFCQSSGALMSDVALQSHVCDFCQAVFPGHTTTRGEFLRHLDTHVT
ncbi:uncharacterized protein zgc:113184 [Mugil cephalus]|uniref:uncharacterized protein zgc:113184 n=1 Tax=Mugil cephalus TaxID=48193 RepID=UPI001FB5F4FE|nr:uncharacterized protein zgc:113184 [Mugil cephalus]XP_047437877.1 uncharacterized protein zgc:113184 [Mugil cephalus]